MEARKAAQNHRAALTALILLCFLCLVCSPATEGERSTSTDRDPFETVIGEIQSLESDRDPKCYATASRLEDFMYGTPLTSVARFAKIGLQKALVWDLWQRASAAARAAGRDTVTEQDVTPLAQRLLPHELESRGNWEVALPDGDTVTLRKHDKRQYSSIAYALRAILAVQQDALLDAGPDTLPLDDGAVDALREFLDIYTLTVLQRADGKARLLDRFEIDEALLADTWRSVARPLPQLATATQARRPAAPAPSRASTRFELIKRIVDQKTASYEAYNQISNQLFVRNLQVYFARHRWPADAALGKQFKDLFTEAMIFYTNDLLLGAEKIAMAAGHHSIRVEDVDRFANNFVSRRINRYEDAIFFPNLPAEERVTIESYDMDAFRDSGIHWKYLQYALENTDYAGTLEPDPFAAELLVENVAQFGVLLLRVCGEIAKNEGAERLHPDHIEKALRHVQVRIDAHSQTRPAQPGDASIASSGESLIRGSEERFFTDVTADVGIAFEHRSSDWLNRLLRSYLETGPGVGNITIPPAFGGSGVAAEDVDGDGDPDILILSGSGNALLLNDGKGRFRDVTRQAGLDWRRPQDGHPGEPRQPIIADFDNDGHQDILITYVDDDHRLYRNLGDARFEDVSAKSGLGGKGSVAGPATVFDFDRDGRLDVYIGYFGDYVHGTLPTLARRNRNGLPNKLYRNLGGLRFEDVTAQSGVGDVGWAQALSHTDLDGDGLQDLIVGNDFGVNVYYRNLGNGKFEDVSSRLGTDKPSYTMSVGITDLNDDDFPDIYISNIVTMNKDEKYVSPSRDTPMKFDPGKLAHMRVLEANDLFLSQAEEGRLRGYQLSDAVARGRSSTGWAWDADFFDFDNDGDDDLYCVNGMNEYNVYGSENPYYTDPLENKRRNVYIPVSARESNVFFLNEGGKLHNASERSGTDLLGNSRSAAYLDFDADGDLDIVLNNYHGPAVFYRNNAQELGGHWLKIQLIGDPERNTNRDAIGARIQVRTADGNRIWREVHGSIGYLSVHPKQQHFGLGRQRKADVVVRWPNGERSRYTGLAADRAYRIHQTDGSLAATIPPKG